MIMIVDGDVESRENRDFGCGPPEWNTSRGKSPYTLDWTWITNIIFFVVYNPRSYWLTSRV